MKVDYMDEIDNVECDIIFMAYTGITLSALIET
jgi:hypothetical protein